MRERPASGSIPDAPGSYQFLDEHGRVLYVGKAKSLRSRVSNYFADPSTLAPKTAQLVASADRVEWIQVDNEVEAILLEYALIKEHRPRFNIRLVDDKSYPWLAVTLPDKWPRAAVLRGRRRPGIRYFGPYAHVGALRDSLDLLLRSFPVRTCSDRKLERHVKLGKPCLLYHIERCSGPCIGAVDADSYARHVDDMMAFFSGATEEIETRLELEMREAAEALDYERAARLRDQLATLRMAVERQEVVTENPEDLDVVGFEDDPLEAAVCVFRVRRGRIVGRRSFVVDKVEELSSSQLVGRVLEELYGDAQPSSLPPPRRRRGQADEGWATGAADPEIWGTDGSSEPGVPRQVLVPELPEDVELYQAFLADRRGGPVAIRVPRRGGKRRLMETVARNASEELTRHRMRRASDHGARARSLEALQQALGLTNAPLRIECYDMSHLGGTDYVGSMVVLEDGLPRKSEYRKFKIRDVPGNDDYAAMEEVLTRRLRALLDERSKIAGPEDGRRRRFAYPPQLLLLDGGKGQLGVGVRVLERLGLSEEIPVAALAKTFEEVFVPGRPDAVRIPRGSEALYLLQLVRDEAHRFAIGYHRTLRARRMTGSALDGVQGLGPARKARLLKELGSVKAVRQATLEELLALAWLPDSVARAVYTHLHAPPDRLRFSRLSSSPTPRPVSSAGEAGSSEERDPPRGPEDVRDMSGTVR
ncbi:MAG TPA: excinuclease ABC subunit UvrC [Acidimicrobiales bacterium]|nr:excinuclease ABC subunit UvrC [Acidimicrobiales bacterium]